LSRVDYFANRNHGLYWQDQIALTERLKLNVGGRFDDFDRGAHNDPWANGQRVSRGPEQHRHQTPYTYRAGVVYGFTANQQVYFNSSSSFQPVTQIPADGRELLPETGHSFEFGHRLQAMNGRMEVTTALYRIVRENVVIALPNQLFDQAGQQSSKGVDFDVNGEIGKGIHVIANYGYTLPRFDDYFESNGLLNLKGFQPKFTHKHAANVWLTKAWKGGFTTSIGSRYLSSVFNDNADTVRLGGWTVFNGAVGFRRSNYEWSLNAENLFNRHRYFLPAQYTNQVYPGQPINVFTTVRFHFR
jgi:iron complex outermembrane recepter protein